MILVQVPLSMARMGDESLGFLEGLKAQELGALVTPGPPPSADALHPGGGAADHLSDGIALATPG